VIEEYGERALRVILFAYRDFDSERACNQDEDTLVSNLTLHFLTGIQVWSTTNICFRLTLFQDPLRPEAQEAVSICTRAGVIVRMLTGDNVSTARAIAINCGILNASDEALVMEGDAHHVHACDFILSRPRISTALHSI
jgi:Ca2+-transporting ATPase